VSLQHLQIGEVSERTGLSLRTIRYYEQMGLVTPSARTSGGFRLYTESDIARLMLVRRMKPLEFSMEEMRDVLALLDALEARGDTAGQRAVLLDRLAMYREVADQRVQAMREQLEIGEEFAKALRREVSRQKRLAEPDL
jgi:DNA-binding transcriptional MerR regulator